MPAPKNLTRRMNPELGAMGSLFVSSVSFVVSTAFSGVTSEPQLR